MLTDLDELLLTVRDPDSRIYIGEAIIAYRGGALRSAVVATWIAVLYDIISKLRILDSQGDAEARKQIAKIEGAVHSNNIKAMAEVEEELPVKAHRTFEFLTLAESKDIERLKEDRNRCAHPSFGGDTLLFNPSHEIVRAHIVHAVHHLLSRPPVQGKAAIERILKDIVGPYFPTEQTQVTRFLAVRYLKYAKESLLANLMKVLVKSILLRLTESEIHGHESAAIAALVAISRTHHLTYRTTMRDLLARHGTSIEDANLVYLLELLGADSSLWGLLEESTHIKINNLVKLYTVESIPDQTLVAALSLGPLRAPMMNRLRELDQDETETLVQRCVSPELSELAVHLFAESRRFSEAKSRAKIVFLRYGEILKSDELRRALQAVPENNQIWDATGIRGILTDYSRTPSARVHLLKDEWTAMINKITSNSSINRSESERRPWKSLIESLESQGLGPFQWPAEEGTSDDEIPF